MILRGKEIFPSLIGNDKLKKMLSSDFADGKSAHAYIIEGPKGSGKHTAALQICASVLCEHKNTESYPLPCGKCSSCRKILSRNSVDVLYVSNGDKASIGVDSIRQIKQSLYITPNDGDKKIYIIENAHLMTDQAQNALLLSLEEPPSYVMFLLLAENSSSLLETVRSRAPSIRMEIFTPDFVKECLLREYGGRVSDEEKLIYAAQLSGGSIGRAKDLFENGGNELTAYKFAAELIEIILKAKKSESIIFLRSLPKDRETLCSILSLSRVALRDIIAQKQNAELLFYSNSQSIPEYFRKVSLKRILDISEHISEAEKNIGANCSTSTVMTQLVMNS